MTPAAFLPRAKSDLLAAIDRCRWLQLAAGDDGWASFWRNTAVWLADAIEPDWPSLIDSETA